MKKMIFLMLTLFFLGAASMNAQVRIGGTADPSEGAVLDLNATDGAINGGKALVLPRFEATSNFPAAATALKGALVYCTGNDSIYSCTGAAWVAVGAAGAGANAGWQLSGNTVADGDFIGAINNKPLVFMIDGDTVGYVAKASIAAWGRNALSKNTTGVDNTAVGAAALELNTSGEKNTALGRMTLSNNTEGIRNTALGHATLNVNNKGSDNTAVGANALRNNQATGNSAIGSYALNLNTSGAQNVAVGDSALRANTTASGNTAVGYRALGVSTTGQYNTAVGDSASSKTTTGSRNTTIGHLAGLNITTGSNNIVIGDSAVAVSATASNQLNIGNWITGTNGRIRIGKTNPQGAAVLDLNVDNSAAGTGNIGGLALPRIALDTTNVQLNGTTPINGTVVYNTNANMKGGQGAGLYMWTGGKWNNITTAVQVSSVTFSPSGTITLQEGNTVTVDATTAPDDASKTALKWTTDQPAVATVSSKGKITAVGIGSATITATTTDGGNKSRTVLVNVVNIPVAMETIGTHQYEVVTLPNNLGTWMKSNSMEGVPTATYNNQNYYSWADRGQACPAPYVVPDSAAWKAVADLLNTMPDYGTILGYNPHVEFRTGYMNISGALNYYGQRSYWWTATRTGELPARATIGTSMTWVVQNAQAASSRLTVRCMKN